jgi:DNA-directed RNA polymerase specialized sigma24 family protein
MGLAGYHAPTDPAESVARIAAARRDRLLGVYRRRLRFEDLEDCYSQATLELLARSRRSPFESPAHIRNALEQKFLSRINDRRRALGGRSGIESALAHAVQVDGPDAAAYEVEDRAAAVERQVIVRSEVRRLREVIGELTLDQRLVLHCQVNLDMEQQEFCTRYGWSAEKFRKVAQRARHKLRGLVEEYQSGERCRRLEPDVLALAARAGSEDQLRRARLHVDNCPACAHYLGQLERASREVAALAPLPVALAAATTKLGWLCRKVVTLLRHPMSGGSGMAPAGFAGSSMVGAGALKAGVLALCIAGAAGSYEVCQHAGISLPLGLGVSAHHEVHHWSRARRAAGAPRVAPVVSAAPAPTDTARGDIAQIRREFGSHRPARAADAVPSASRPSASAQPAKVVSEEQREFGFER